MVDLYITYSLRECHWVSQLVSALKAEGYTVYWRHAVVPGEEIRTDISAQALESARCVIAVWSETAIDDFWVLTDAQAACQQHKLVSVMAKPVVIPRPCRSAEPIFMHNWDGSTMNSSDYQALITELAKQVKPSQANQLEKEQESQARQRRIKAEIAQRKQAQRLREIRAKQQRESV